MTTLGPWATPNRRLLPILGLVVGLTAGAGAEPSEVENPTRDRWAEQARHLDRWVHGGRIEPHWLADGSTFWARLDTVQGERLVQVDPTTGGLPVTLDTAPVREVRPQPRTVRQPPGVGIPPVLEVLSPDGRWWLTEQGHDLAVRPAESALPGARAQKLTDDGSETRFWSVEQGTWSPDGRFVAAWKEITEGVPRLPIVDWSTQPETITSIPYPRSGEPMRRFELGVFEVATGQRIVINLDVENSEIKNFDENILDLAKAKETSTVSNRWFFLLGWRAVASPGEDRAPQLLVLTLDRTYQELRLLAIAPATPEGGAAVVQEVLREDSDTFLDGLRFWMLWQNKLTQLPDGERFLWLSERSGWRHVELWSFEEGKLADLTSGRFEVQSVLAVDANWVYLTANAVPGRPYDTHFYRVPVTGGPLERLTEAKGEHSITLAPSRRFFLDRHASPTRPPTTELRRIDGTLVRVLSQGSLDPSVPYLPGERFVVTAADGATPLHGVLYKPWDFDPQKRYPVLDAIYNGPFIPWAPQTFLDPYALEAQGLAQQGFVVMMLDGRGTPERGKSFQDVVFRRFGQHEVADHATALEQLARKRPWLDLDRVGIYGVSWGAYMATRAVLQRGDLFRAAVALNGVTDLLNHPAGSIEGYMGLPDDNPDGYAAASNIALAPRLDGALLLAHGTTDVNAPLSGALRLVDALQRAGKAPELLLLPGESHALSDTGRQIFDQARIDFFRRHLFEED